MVPLSTCNKAADTLIDWFGPDDLHKVVGGERWWQVRGLDGIEAEWITENEFLDSNTLKKDGKQKSKELSAEEETIQKMEKLETVMVRFLIYHRPPLVSGSERRHSSTSMVVSARVPGVYRDAHVNLCAVSGAYFWGSISAYQCGSHASNSLLTVMQTHIATK